jgi:hypothetical protein
MKSPGAFQVATVASDGIKSVRTAKATLNIMKDNVKNA